MILRGEKARRLEGHFYCQRFWCQVGDRRDTAARIVVLGFATVGYGCGGTKGQAPGKFSCPFLPQKFPFMKKYTA